MKFLTHSMLMITLLCAGCGMEKSPLENSHLSGSNHDHYLLKLATNGQEGIYHLKVCLAEASPEEGCVQAIQNNDGEEVTFAYGELFLKNEWLSDEERQLIEQLSPEWQERWQSYQTALAWKSLGDKTATSSTLTIGGITGAILGLETASSIYKIAANKRVITHHQGALSRVFVDILQNEQNWDRLFEEGSREEIIQKIKTLEHEITSKGYPIQRPSSLLDKPAQIRLQARGHLVSDEFFTFLQSQISSLPDLKKHSTIEAFKRPYLLEDYTYQGMKWSHLVQEFVKRGHNVENVIDPQFSSSFIEAQHINSSFYPENNLMPKNIEELKQALLHEKQAQSIFDQMNDFVRYSGVPYELDVRTKKLHQMKVAFKTGNLKHLPKATKQLLLELSEDVDGLKQRIKLSTNSLKRSYMFGGAIMVALTGGVVATIVLSRRGLESAKNALHPDDLNLVTTAMDPMDQSSVEEILDHVTTVLQNTQNNVTEGNGVTYKYCIPVWGEKEDAVSAQCG